MVPHRPTSKVGHPASQPTTFHFQFIFSFSISPFTHSDDPTAWLSKESASAVKSWAASSSTTICSGSRHPSGTRRRRTWSQSLIWNVKNINLPRMFALVPPQALLDDHEQQQQQQQFARAASPLSSSSGFGGGGGRWVNG
jgi:hypothetical protein